MSSRIRHAETSFFRKAPLDFLVGDTLEVSVRIPEGDKERIQVFSGRVIRKRGIGLAETFTVRRIVMGEGVERIFPMHSPHIAGVREKTGFDRLPATKAAQGSVHHADLIRGLQKFIGKDDLIRNKEASGRPKDRIDLEELRKLS